MFFSRTLIRKISLFAFILCFAACNDSDSNSVVAFSSTPVPQKANAYQELIDKGGDKYKGTYAVTPISSEPLAGSDVVVHSFPTDPDIRFPSSMTGEPYKVETRDGTSDELFIYFQGGGICAEESCMAFNLASFIANRLPDAFDLFGGVLSRDASNPLGSYNLVHANYSDGSLMLGDIDQQPRKDIFGQTIYINHRGLLNLTATFEVAKKQYPNPSRIVIAGSSAGSLASLGAIIFARTYYPDTPIHGILDSGTGVINEVDPQFIERAAKSLGIWELIGELESCPNCISNGHATNFLRWILDQDNEDEDKKIKIALLSSTRDHVISTYALNPSSESDAWKKATERELTSLAKEYPERLKVFLVPGDSHTFLIGGGFINNFIANNFLNLVFPDGEDDTPQRDAVFNFISAPFFVGNRAAEILGSQYFSLGYYDQPAINMNNQRVTLKSFIRDFLQDTANTVNVINLEDPQ